METLKMKVGKTSPREIEVILPVAGMMGTMAVGSDRYAIVCVNVHSNKKCDILVCYNFTENNIKDVITTDKDGLEYLSKDLFDFIVKQENKQEEFRHYSLRKNGTWYECGTPIAIGCCAVSFGHARPYCDPSF